MRKRLILSSLVICILLTGAVIGFVIVTATGGSDSRSRGQSATDVDSVPNPSTSGGDGSGDLQTAASGQANNGSTPADPDGSGTTAADSVSGSFLSDDSDNPRPRGCQLTPGETCRVRFLGSYRLSSTESGTIVVSAHENGSEKPVTSKSLSVKKGTFRWPAELIYVVSPQAETVQFRIILLDPDGKQLAAQDPPGPVIPISR